MANAKPFDISKVVVAKAYRRIRSNGGTYGIDEQSLKDFDKDCQNNLYKIWNRMSSGSYMPPAVRRVEIPKKGGGKRPLGIPTVSDRIAQMVVKMQLEPLCEVVFHENSYAYRPERSAHMALDQARKRCWKYSWVLDLDIKSFFDSINQDLLMRAVRRHTQETWVLLYIERWLKAPVQLKNGEIEPRDCGTPQGSVISPLLANLFLHYAFDKWMDINIPSCPFERYADDAIVHCHTYKQALYVKQMLEARFAECGLTLHPEKTKIVYCKFGNKKRETEDYPDVSFDFLGYTFKPRKIKARNEQGREWSFTPAVSAKARKEMLRKIRKWELKHRSKVTLEWISENINPIVRGWILYYGKFRVSELKRIIQCINYHLLRWTMWKYRKSRDKAFDWLKRICKTDPCLFVHWNRLRYGPIWTIRAV